MAKDLSWDELSTTNPTELSWDSLSVEPPKPKSRTWGDVAGDIGVTALKGAIGLPQALVGLADFPTGGIVGKTLEDIGYRPNEASKQLDDLYSDPQKAANRKVAEAEGFTGTLAAHLQNPSTIATTVGESVPQILGGAGVARGLMKAFPKVAAWAAGALGEGIMGAGSAEEQTRAESADGLTTAKQGMAALASGAGTAAFGMAGGKLAGSKLGQRLGLADVDTMLASGKFTPSTAGFFKAVAGSGISEGVLEEMPQSAWEQMLQNYAQEKPLTEGMGKAMASGLVAGAAMGGAGGGFNAAMAPKPANPAVPPVAPPADPLQLGNTPDPMISFPDGTVARRSEVDQYIANLPEDQQVAARAKLSGFAPQKATIADIGAAPNMDDAIAAFTQVVSAPVDLAPDISDAQEFADLVQSETRNQQVMLAQMDQERIKQAQLDQIPAIAAEQNVTQEALQRAAALDAPTAMGSAFSKLFDKTIGAEPEARETAPAPVPAPKPVPEPRIVARDPGMLAMPRELAELRATMNGGEVVRFANINKDTGAPNGKFAYTVLEDGSKPSLARVANAAPPASVVDQRLTPVSKRTESTNEKAPEAIEASPPAQTSQAEVIEPNFEAAKALIKQQKAATGNKSKENLVRIKLRQLAAKTPINHGKTVSALDIAATRLGMGEGKLKGLEFAPEEQPQAPVEPAQVATETVAKPRKKPAGGKTLRSKAYDKNPLLTFLATHGLFHDKAQPNSHKSEFSPDKGIMVMGYGPVFKKTGKRLDALTQNAIEEGYLPKDGTEAQLRELVRRAVAGEKISPLYAEGVAEQLAEQTFSEHLAQQQEAAQDDDYDPFQPLDELGYEIEDALSAGRSDLTPALQNEVDALLLQAEDVGIDIDQIKSDAATETEKGSQDDYLSATKQRLEAAITGRAANSNGGSTEQDGGQGRGQATVTGSAESRGENDDRQEQSGSQEGLTSPTREDVLAQQDRADAAKKAEEKAAADAANRAKADAEHGEFTLTGSDRAADVGAAGGQQDIFSSPAAEATAILDAADVTGKERIDVLKDVKKGDITPDELKAAYPAKEDKFPSTAQGAIDAFNADDSAQAVAIMAKLKLDDLKEVGGAIGFRPQNGENAKSFRERIGTVADKLTLTNRKQTSNEMKLHTRLTQLASDYDRAIAHRDRAIANGAEAGSSAFEGQYEGQWTTIDKGLEILENALREESKSPDYAKVSAMVKEARPAIFDAAKPDNSVKPEARPDSGGILFSRGETQNPTTVSALQSAIKDLLGTFGTNKLGRIVATTAAEIKSTWEPLIGKTNLESEGNAGKAQAFFDPKTNTVFLIADNIEAGTETAVLAHELMHKHGKSVLGEAGWNKLHSVISSWANAKEGSQERQVYDQASAAVERVGVELSTEELFPYAVEAAIKMGIKPDMKGGAVARWLESVRQNLKMVWQKITNKPETFKAQDLVNLAFGIAQRENNPDLGAINEPMTDENIVGNQGGRSADDSTPGASFDAQAAFEKHGGDGDIDESTDIRAKSLAFADMAEATGYEVAGRGDKYVTITKSFGENADGYDKKAVINVRISDHSNVNRGHHFGDTDINIAPDDGYSRDTFEDALRKIKSAYVNDDLDTIIPNESTAPDSGGAMFSRAGIVGQTNRQHTPEQLRAMKNVGFDVEAPTLKERAQALYKDAGKKLAQGIVDQFAPVKDLDKNAYGLLRLAKGASGAFEAFLQGGKLKLTDGVYDFDDANKGGVIDKLLIPLQGEHHDFMRWVAANRAERLQGEGKENLFSAQDIADLKTLASGTADFDYTVQTGPAKGRVTRDRTLIYADANRVFNEFNKNVLDMAEQSGLIDGASRKVWEHEFYVPFYRVADEDGGGVRGMSVKGSVLRQQAFKELKGGKNALNADLLDNTLMNWAHLLDASAKNRAAKATIEAAERMGVATGGDQATLAQMGASVHNKSGVVWFMDGGQKRYSLIDKEGDGPYLMTAINALEYAGMRNPVMNAMGAMKHALTVGVTASPFFKIRNLIRDSVQAIGTGNLSYNPAKNITEGWKLTDPKSDAYFRLLAGGGTIHFGTMLEGSEAKRVQALVESGVDDATILGDDRKVKAFYRKYIEPGITAYSELGNRGEAINRASLYDQLRKQGVNHADASLQARDLMDFSMQGSFTSIRFLTQVVPFLNARLQGLYKLGRAAKEDPARFSMVLGSVAAISLGLLAAYSDDDDWKKREDWDRNNFWWFKVGGTAFRIPKPFEIGAIATLAERGFELAFDKEMTNKRFMGQVMTLLGDNLSMNPVPQLVKPMLDVYANKDSFSGRPIETMGMEKLKSEYRFTDRTSMTARAASTGLNAVTGLVGKDALSPVQIDSMLRGYFGWLGSFIVGAGDKIARPATGQKDQASPDYWKVSTGGMVSDLGDAPSRYVSAMYDQAKTLEEAYGTYRMLVKEGKIEEAKEFMADHRDELSRYRHVESVKRTEAKFNERIRMIERSALSSDAKRDAIRKVKEQKDRVARQLAPA